jgi:hypothetical protein
MSNNDRPLPKPPKTPFGRARSSSEQSPDGLLSDRMAEAAIQGKLDEFLRSELPDSEEARTLAKMMMGMSGMMPEEASAPPAGAAGMPEVKTRPAGDRSPESGPVPDEVASMVQSGDVKGLMDMLRREHQKRSPGSALSVTAETLPAQETAAPPSGMPAIDKELVDAMIKIAKDNSVSADWIILRAIKVYVEEYQRTGKL